MIDTILLNKEFFKFKAENLPCLIQYGEKMGGSQMSIVLIADLFAQGHKIVFLCGYTMAQEEFMKQIDGDYSNVKFVANVEDFTNAENYQIIILGPGNESLLHDASTMVSDFNERIIFVKNIELFSEALFDLVLPRNNIILSGNIDECVAKWKITQKSWNSMIVFNQPQVVIPNLDIPNLDQWTAYYKSSIESGVISIQK